MGGGRVGRALTGVLGLPRPTLTNWEKSAPSSGATGPTSTCQRAPHCPGSRGGSLSPLPASVPWFVAESLQPLPTWSHGLCLCPLGILHGHLSGCRAHLDSPNDLITTCSSLQRCFFPNKVAFTGPEGEDVGGGHHSAPREQGPRSPLVHEARGRWPQSQSHGPS